MRRPDDALLLDMLLYARRVASRIADVSRQQFDEDEDLQFSLTYQIQVIGEAANRLSSEQRASHTEIPWRSIMGMRHVVVHDYFRVDLDVVWETATKSVPELVASLERIVPPEIEGAP
jgi:uncharacterized protein with HEPN domain